MATPQHALLACCGSVGQCCGTIAGVWYLCLAILVLVLLISCNDILMSRCYIIGFPWSKMKLYHVHEIICDEEIQVLLVLNDSDNDGQLSLEQINKPPPPPPYSAI
ncbi:uncharacterized protein LOC117640693 [Thrips palmi]|uniref:Uncharacterized protein LOC117640693 n=1 Tax=Thrips palmi TaxID=161013 RepID=A0A6P8YHG0_THRPL|nr:uncharacterized protein LOC117640693 [Thrips palmi]